MRPVLTNDHNVEVEALAHTLAMPLVGQVGEPDVASKLPADNVPHVARGLGCGLGIPGGDGLGCVGAAVKHGVAVLDVAGRCGLAVRDGVARDGGGLRRRARRGCCNESVSSRGFTAVRLAGGVEALARRVLPGCCSASAQGSWVIEHQRIWSLYGGAHCGGVHAAMREPGASVCARGCFVGTGGAQCCGMRGGGRRRTGGKEAILPIVDGSAFVATSWSRVSNASGSCEAVDTRQDKTAGAMVVVVLRWKWPPGNPDLLTRKFGEALGDVVKCACN